MWVSVDNHHYWHEVRFLYGATHFSISDLLTGAFNPHQVGGLVDEVGASGFYLAKVLHIWLLKQLFGKINPALGGFSVAVWISVAIIGISGAIIHKIIKMLITEKIEPWQTISCFLMAPITPYLGGKLLSEVTSLFFVLLSIWLFLIGLKQTSRKAVITLFMSGIFLLIAGLARLDMILSFLAFLVAGIFYYPESVSRKDIIKSCTFVTLVFLGSYLSVIGLLGKGPYVLLIYFKNYCLMENKSLIMCLLGTLTFGGVIYLLAVFAFSSKNKKNPLFFMIWFAMTIIPMMLITINHMIEPRYLTCSLPPLVGLGTMGLFVLMKKLNRRFRITFTVSFLVVLIVVNSFILKLMPYELDKSCILKASEKIMSVDSSVAILVPWAYTDFHFLSIMLPGSSVYNVNSLAGNKINGKYREYWLARFRSWYGNAYLDDDQSVQKLLAERQLYYLGWGKYPPAENMMKIADRVGVRSISRLIDALPLKNHLAESWMWHSQIYNFKPAGKCGQYTYYKVTLN